MQSESLAARSSNRLKQVRALALTCLVLIASTIAWHQLFGASKQTLEMREGARYIAITFPGETKPALNLVCFKADQFKMIVVNNPDPKKHLYIADMAKAAKAVAGCNGGYFDTKKFTPSGLGIAQGVSQGTFQSMGREGALFGVRNGVPFIAAESEFKPSPEISDLVQCGPMLVDNGHLFQEDSKASNARTFVMTDGQGQWAIGNGAHFALGELAALLAKPGLIEGFSVQRAMNLDGGPSTGLWWQDSAGQAHESRERWSVANMILVVPK